MIFPKAKFPSIDYFTELAEGLDDLTLPFLEQRYRWAVRHWDDPNMIEQMHYLISKEQCRVAVILADAINLMRSLTYREVLEMRRGKQ